MLGFGIWSSSNAKITIQQSTGNVGIGTASPSYLLDVNGTARANDYRFNYKANTRLYTNDAGCTGGGVAVGTHNGITLCFIGQ
jgi:hypothetical protein